MNAAYNRTLKQAQSVQRELDAYESGRSTGNLQEGKLNTALHSLHYKLNYF